MQGPPGLAPKPRRDNAGVSVGHYENFPVASVLCPPRLRPAVAALYHFARTADDLADEGEASQAHRLQALADYRADLHAVFSGQAPSPRWRGVFHALGLAREQYALPLQPLDDLVNAFEQDTGNPVYATRKQLLDYCSRSANPVGRLLLHLYGVGDAASLERADAVCTALQLINFWQDLSVDLPRGRHYVPEEDLRRHGLARETLSAQRESPATAAMVADLCAWARDLMLEGAPLALQLPGRAGWELRFVVQGGLRVLDRIAQQGYRTLKRRPKLKGADLPALLWNAVRMRHALGREPRPDVEPDDLGLAEGLVLDPARRHRMRHAAAPTDPARMNRARINAALRDTPRMEPAPEEHAPQNGARGAPASGSRGAP